MSDLDRWFNDFTSTPAGELLLFLAVFLTRIVIAQWSERRAARKRSKRKPKTA